MVTTGEAVDRVAEIRRDAISALGELSEKAARFELPEPPEMLGRYREKLVENTYKVLVVGEVKRGKSTFVNALIGRDLLPTDVDVATSQVFSIRPSEEEACRIRFEDGSSREISFEELPRYGSQVVEDLEGAPSLEETIRWIEVDVPIRFLPEGVSILDTPGLGALYATHARITQRYVPEADAVIFVLHSKEPVLDADLRTIEDILEATPNIFFIQTWIDRFRNEWEEVRQRNEEILRERFGEKLADARVWPVSSTHLLKASSAGEETREAYLAASRHEDLMGALRRFLERVAGWSRSAEAMMLASEYYSATRKTLAGRLASLEASSKQERAALQQEALEHKRRFEAEWGLKGAKLAELRDGIQKAISIGKLGFTNAMQPGGDMERYQKEKIENLSSLGEANRLAREMPDEVVAATITLWTRTCNETQRHCAEVMGDLAISVEEAAAVPEPGLSLPDEAIDAEFKRDYTKMLMAAGRGAMMAGGVSGLVGLIPAFPPAALIGIPVFVVVARQGMKDMKEGELRAARRELFARLADVRGRVYRHFFDVDPASGRFSIVEEYFRGLEISVNERIGDMVRRKAEEMNAEVSRLTEAIKLGDAEREERAARVREQLAAWDETGRAAKSVMARIKALEKRRPVGRER